MKCHKEDAPLLGLMGQSMRLIGKKAQELYAEYDLNRAQSGILFALHQEDSMSQKELAKRLNVTPPSITSMIKKMEQEGYSLDDLEQAEKLSVKTGRKAIELAKEKGKTSENRQWSDVVKDSEILSTEEQLGLSKEQIQQLKDKSLSKEERIEVAVLLLNETCTFEEVLVQLEAGKTVEELKGQESE